METKVRTVIVLKFMYSFLGDSKISIIFALINH